MPQIALFDLHARWCQKCEGSSCGYSLQEDRAQLKIRAFPNERRDRNFSLTLYVRKKEKIQTKAPDPKPLRLCNVQNHT